MSPPLLQKKLTITPSGDNAAIERHELSMLTRAERTALFRSLHDVVCSKDVTEDGQTTEVGIFPWYMKKKFDHMLHHDLDYGEDGGVMRKADVVYVYRNVKKTRRGDTTLSGPPIAFALVCSPGLIFHRLHSKLVANSVYLAMLCGSNATALYHQVLSEARERGKVVTLDSLKHAITYYLRPEFGTAVAIDTRVSFDVSKNVQEYLAECNMRDEKPDMSVLRAHRNRIISEIAPGEVFVPVSECSKRGHEDQREGYMQAHIVVFGGDIHPDDVRFDAICMDDSFASRTMEPYENSKRKHSRVEFGEPVAVTKDNETLTLNLAEINRLVRNGDYRLVHSHAKSEPSEGLIFAKETIDLFKSNQDALTRYMERPKNTIQRALADLYKKDKQSLRLLIKELARF